jgi:hypothetical protein
MGASLNVIKEFGPTLTLFLLTIWNVTSLRRIQITATVIVILAVMLVGQSAAAYHFGFMQEQLLIRGTSTEDAPDESPADDGTVRVRGLGQMNDPNDLALVLVASLAFISVAWQSGRTFRNTLLLGVPGAFLIYGVYLTHSRGGMLGVLVVIFVGLVSRTNRINALIITGLAAIVFIGSNFTGNRGMSSSEESAAGRLDAWSEGLDMFRSNPLLGVGFRNFTEHHTLTAHNSFVLCFAELGSVGYGFWLALLTIALLQLNQVRQCKDDSFHAAILRRYALALLASLTGVLVSAFFLSRSYNVVLYLLVAITASLYASTQRSGYSMTLPSLSQLVRGVAALEIATIAGIYLLVRMNRLFVH